MPIYAYRCADCGHQFDALQRLADPVLTDCPSCGKAALAKLVTAAGFQLKGSGWYATDFRNTAKPAAADAKAGEGKAADAKSADAKPADAGKAADTPAGSTDAKPAAPAAANVTPGGA
jgi:putative FmdB family regulatory protein